MKLAERDELQSGDRKTVLIDELPALLVRVGDEYYAIEDVCTHDGQPLSDGPISDTEITCSRHGARFDLKCGKALSMPATVPVKTFPVEIRDDGIYCEEAGSSIAENNNHPQVMQLESPSFQETRQATPGETQSADSTETDNLLEVLKEVVDPELFVNIVDLGLIYNIEQIDSIVKVDMTLTSPACPVGPQLVQQSKMALERLDDVEEAQINLVMSPPWSPDRMTDDARDKLGIF